jgi:Squalene-hopene cyclase C-terminal domain/Prenyltransferase and squalene oxidase repeat
MRRGFGTCSRRQFLAWAALSAAPSLGLAWAEEKPATDIAKAIERGIKFLHRRQNPDGSWGSAHRTKDLNIFAPVPGAHRAFRCGVTALCVEALIESRKYQQDAEARRALERGELWLLENLPQLRRGDAIAIYNVWGHAYGLQTLAAMKMRPGQEEALKPRLQEAMTTQVKLLREYESIDGGWGYYDFRLQSKRPATDSTSFVTATVLVALKQGANAGLEVPAGLRQRAYDSIQRQRKPDHTYIYGEYLKMRPMMDVNRPGGSLGRSQACNLALRRWGDKTITDRVLTEWLDRLVARNGWLSIGRKRPVPHESWFQVAGYFFYYGHYYAALCIEELGPKLGSPYRPKLAEIVAKLQEEDGSWWDYPLYDYHQQYGTAYAIMTLLRCQEPNSPSEKGTG